MYLPKHFEETRPDRLHALLRLHPLGLLITQDALGGAVADALPLMLDLDRGPHGTLVGHVARANPLWQSASVGREVLVVFQGPEGYISPNGYASKAEHGRAVPTWNYAMVQAHGRLQVVDDPATVLGLVTRLTQRHEARQAQPWAVGDAPETYIAALLKAIVYIEIPLTVALLGKYKLNQHRSQADQQSMQDLLQSGDAPTQDLALWMREPPAAV